MRLFIAIELPDDVRMQLVRVRESLKSQIANLKSQIPSYTCDENLHITLKFLGEVEPRKLDELKESLSHVRVGGAIELFAEKLECFPPRGPIRIVAAGFGGDVAGIKSLHQAIEQRCQHLGFDRETRAYRAHVTLARARPTLPPSVRNLTAEFPGPVFTVNEFALIESRLSPTGSEYRTIERFAIH